jgi:hypothetical protein
MPETIPPETHHADPQTSAWHRGYRQQLTAAQHGDLMWLHARRATAQQLADDRALAYSEALGECAALTALIDERRASAPTSDEQRREGSA